METLFFIFAFASVIAVGFVFGWLSVEERR